MGAKVTGAESRTIDESLAFDEDRVRLTLLERSRPRERLSMEEVDESDDTGFG